MVWLELKMNFNLIYGKVQTYVWPCISSETGSIFLGNFFF